MQNLGWYVFVAVIWVASKLCDLANALGYPCALNTTHPMKEPAPWKACDYPFCGAGHPIACHCLPIRKAA